MIDCHFERSEKSYNDESYCNDKTLTRTEAFKYGI